MCNPAHLKKRIVDIKYSNIVSEYLNIDRGNPGIVLRNPSIDLKYSNIDLEYPGIVFEYSNIDLEYSKRTLKYLNTAFRNPKTILEYPNLRSIGQQQAFCTQDATIAYCVTAGSGSVAL